MESDAELKELIDQPVAIRWMGPDAHIVAYPIKAHQVRRPEPDTRTQAHS